MKNCPYKLIFLEFPKDYCCRKCCNKIVKIICNYDKNHSWSGIVLTTMNNKIHDFANDSLVDVKYHKRLKSHLTK